MGKLGGNLFHPRAIAAKLGIAKLKDYMGFHIGNDFIDQSIEMIATGLIPQARAGFMVPAGATALIAELADQTLFGGGSHGGSGLGLSFAGGGGTGSGFAGD